LGFKGSEDGDKVTADALRAAARKSDNLGGLKIGWAKKGARSTGGDRKD